MGRMSTGGLLRQAMRGLFAVAICGVLVQASAAQTQPAPLLLRPDTINLDRLCRQSQLPPAPTEDWRLWDEATSDQPARRLIEISRFYSRPNFQVPSDPPTAERLLRVAMKAEGLDGRDAKAELGRLMTDGDSGLTDRPEGVALMREAYRAGDQGLAVALARVLANDATLREPDESIEAYIDLAIANRSAEAPLLYAQLLDRGILAPRQGFDRVSLVNQAILFLLDDLQAGECRSMLRLGAIYRDRVFAEHFNPELAAEWYNASLTTRDPQRSLAALRLAEMIGNSELPDREPEDVARLLRQAYELESVDAGIRLANQLTTLPLDAPERADRIAIAERLASLDVTDGLALMVRLHSGSFGDPRDAGKTVELLLRLVLRHDAPAFALEQLAKAYLDGDGIAADPVAARKLYERALDLGSESAARALARFYLEGIGVAADIPLGIRYLRRSAENNSGAAAQLASYYRCGVFVPQDMVVGEFWRNRALMLGEIGVISRTTDNLLVEADPAGLKERVDLLLIGERITGSRRARSMLGAAYQRGFGVKPDQAKADAWFLKATESGDDQGIGLMQVANRFLEYPGGIEGVALALPLLEKGVSIKDPAATFRLGQLLLAGSNSLPRDVARGRALLKQSAELGYSTGMREYALLLTAPEQREEQLTWLRRAAADADAPAVEALILRQPDLPDAMALLANFEYRMACDAGSVLSVIRAYDTVKDPSGPGKRDAWLQRATALFAEDPRLPLNLGRYFKEREPQDVALATRYLEAAISLNQMDARLHLATLYLDSASPAGNPARGAELRDQLVAEADAKTAWQLYELGGDLDITDAQRETLLARAAEGDVVDAMQLLGSRLVSDGQTEDDRRKGVVWLEKAAAADDVRALNLLALLARTGLIGPVDMPKYVSYTRRQAELGDRRAMIDLAAALETGLAGERNLAESEKWRAAAGSTDAVNAVLEAMK